ncbi:MAG: ATP-binding cassette domain-containing protein [Desulfobacterales bacterium]|nr:ATP-binding cassette domain-containing protein [Desulfobacterales bacterium]
MLFDITNLSKVYGDRKVLDIPELTLEKGKVYGLLGPNGSGKTTLLEILSFLLLPTTGQIVYDSRKVDYSEGFLQWLRREVVIVEQHPILFTTSVYKNVEFGPKVRKMPKDRRERVVHEMLDLVGMREFAGARANRLSGGETQRVAIARALSCSPKVILLDEPTSNVDIENQIAIEAILRDINIQKGISVIFTTHNTSQATRLSGNIVFLFNGKPASSIYENIFTGPITADGNGDKYCSIHDKLKVAVRTNKTGYVKISVNPMMIKVLPVQAADAGDRRLVGRVIQLTDEGGHVRALVDVGLPFSVLLSQEEYKRAPILAGERVALFCPQESVEVM